MQLDEIRSQLKHITNTMESIFSQANVQDSFSVNHDRMFGSRAFNLRIVWDDFSPTTLENKLAEIKMIFEKYKELRLLEKQIMEQLSIDRRISSTNSSYGGKQF
jgi:predicted component of type VI protein secretion system